MDRKDIYKYNIVVGIIHLSNVFIIICIIITIHKDNIILMYYVVYNFDFNTSKTARLILLCIDVPF